jgi:chromosome segregation ATPase
MSNKREDVDVLPAIRPAQDEVSSYRRSNRSDAPKQSNFNGILVFVILTMAIMMGVGGFTLYEVQKKLNQSNVLLARGQENIRELDNRLAATGTDVSKTLQIMQGQTDTNVSEIDKLWAIAHRQNKPDIQKNKTAISKVRADMQARITPLKQTVEGIAERFDLLSKSMTEVKQDLIEDNEEVVTEVSLVRGQVQDQSVQVEGNRREISILANQMKEAQEAIDVIDRYRRQINQRLTDLQGQIQDQPPSQTTSP